MWSTVLGVIPSYPPYYFRHLPGLYLGSAVITGIGFSIGFGIVRLALGLGRLGLGPPSLSCRCESVQRDQQLLHSHDRRPAIKSANWSHDPYHRRGVVYRAPQLQAAKRNAPSGAPEARRDFRGFAAARRPARPQGPRRRNRSPSVLRRMRTLPPIRSPAAGATSDCTTTLARRQSPAPRPTPAPAFQSFARRRRRSYSSPTAVERAGSSRRPTRLQRRDVQAAGGRGSRHGRLRADGPTRNPRLREPTVSAPHPKPAGEVTKSLTQRTGQQR